MKKTLLFALIFYIEEHGEQSEDYECEAVFYTYARFMLWGKLFGFPLMSHAIR